MSRGSGSSSKDPVTPVNHKQAPFLRMRRRPNPRPLILQLTFYVNRWRCVDVDRRYNLTISRVFLGRNVYSDITSDKDCNRLDGRHVHPRVITEFVLCRNFAGRGGNNQVNNKHTGKRSAGR